MATYWHIAWEGYEPGAPLRCRNRLLADGVEVPWRWDEADEGFDCDVVCLFPDTPRGRTEADWLWSQRPTDHLLRVDLPDGFPLETVEEGYPAALGEIPAEQVTHVRAGDSY